MNLDMRTIIFSYIITNTICTGVMALVWQQNRRRLSGAGFWLADFVMQSIALGLVILRGAVPDIVSMVVSNTLAVAGTVLLYEGLGRFVQRRPSQAHNIVLLAVFVAVHTYFTLAHPSLEARDINLSMGLLVICAQCAWLTLRRTQADATDMAYWVGWVLVAYCLFSLGRIILTLILPPGNNFFTESQAFDQWVLVIYQMLFIALTFSLVLLVNHRLFLDLQIQSQALRVSQDKFAKAFHASPDAILITRVRDGQIVEVNEGFCRLTGYSRAESVGSSTLALQLWANPQQRAEYIAALQANQSVRDYEYDFITKSGAKLTCLCCSETVDLEGEPHILSVVRDITERRRAEAEMVRLASFPQSNPLPILEVDMNSMVTYANSAALAALEKLGRSNETCAFVPSDLPAIWQALAHGETSGIERVVELDNTVWSEHIHLVPQFQSVRIYAADTTERRLMQARIEQQQRAAAAQAERERLARELHDNLSQVLAFMNVQAQAAYDCLVSGDSAQAGAHMLRLAEAARETHRDMRQFIADSLIVVSPQAGFLPALQQSLGQFERIHGLHTELEIAAKVEWSIDPASQAQLLRIIQEALSNVSKHAQVHSVRVSLTADASQVCALIVDDGIGFDSIQATPNSGKRFGLRIMQDRAAELGGAVEISSAPGQGTQVRVCLPVTSYPKV